MPYLQYLYKSDHIKLIIEEDSVGYYLLVYNDAYSNKSDQDYLLDTLEDAFEEAQDRFKVPKEQWILQDKIIN